MKPSQPLVTAIVIFLNEERFLAEAIESVLAQTYPDWELILVDDGSTDRSSGIAQAYAARQPERIRYVEHEGHVNRGMGASRNLGLDHARGTYIGFLDADDVWMPDKLRGQVAILEAHPDVDMVYGRTLIWHSWRPDAVSGAADRYYALGVQADAIVEPPNLLVSLIHNRAQTPTTCNALMRADAIAGVGRFEAVFRGMFEDQVFFMKLALTAKIFVASESWARYRQHGDSCSAQAESSGELRQMRLRLLSWLSGYLRRRRVRVRPVWRALRRQRLEVGWPAAYRLYVRCNELRRAVLSRTGA
jgi:glycosyltransferase involved in cell wall biosynthesis